MSDFALLPLIAFQEDGKYLIFVDGNPGQFYLLVFNSNTAADLGSFRYTTLKEVISFLSFFIPKSFKAVFLSITVVTTSDSSNNYEICKALKNLLNSRSILNHFYSATDIGTTKHLINSNISVNENDAILQIFAENDGFNLHEYCYTKNGYEYKKNQTIKWDSKMPAKNLQNEILEFCDPKQIILQKSKLKLSMKAVQNALKPRKITVVENTPILPKHVKEISKWFFNPAVNSKFHLIPTNCKQYPIITVIGEIKWLIIEAHIFDRLPFNKSVEIPKFFQNISILQYNPFSKNCDTIYDVKLSSECHKLKVSFNIDEQHFPTLKVEKIIIPSIQMLPQKLDENFKENIPVIGFFDNSSVICVYNKDDGKYEFLNEWNGLYGDGLFIDFSKEKPEYVTKNIEPLKTDLSFLVYDLIKIMSMPVDAIVADEKWKFKITSDEDHPVLIEFVNFDGRKTAASPALLMAMLLKEHRKIIKTKIGKKPEKLGFCLFDNFNLDESKRIKEKLQESCKLLKIQCCFV